MNKNEGQVNAGETGREKGGVKRKKIQESKERSRGNKKKLWKVKRREEMR